LAIVSAILVLAFFRNQSMAFYLVGAGIYAETPLMLQELGDRYGISRERVRRSASEASLQTRRYSPARFSEKWGRER
jgi:hypothetical protein